jgi:rare lipoprotein A
MRLLLTLCLMAFLSACVKQPPLSTQKSKHQTHRTSKKATTQDGAPKHPLPFFFQALLPKSEPMSRYGNPESYMVSGRAYKIMRSSSGYKAKGMASWYGTKFHKQRTSSGEKYNMYAMTAAHRTLPIPSYIRVKNLNNGRTAIVRVNDRGPFHSNRLLDLSYGAARYLGVMPKGTAMVEIESIAPKSQKQAHVARYYIQAGAFQSTKFATILKNKVKKVTTAPILIEKHHKKYIVEVGPFANKQLTDEVKQKLAKLGANKTITFLK